AEMLKADGIDLTVVDVCAIKPADEAGIVEILKSHDRIFTAEEHNIIGGLGGMIAEVAGEKCPKPIHRIGVKDRYAESGPAAGLMKKYGLDAEGVYKEIKENL
ncbi:MAG: transketolase C-terminal domain-containing protein, partial [Stecheria intestinalis]|nr:transketolase C-terminal domain-containing protein [Stecheria intestinalis]